MTIKEKPQTATASDEAVQAAANGAHEELISMASEMKLPMKYMESISVGNYRVMRRALTAALPHLAISPAEPVEQWHRANSDNSVLFYTLRQDGWNKGQPSMVNDIQVHVSLNNGSKNDLNSVADALFASLPATPTSKGGE